MLFGFIHPYAYFFSLIFAILPLTLLIDSRIGFSVIRRLFSKAGFFHLLLTVVFWSVFDVLWIKKLGSFPQDRIIASISGVPIEEMLFFVLAFYNVITVFAWAKDKANP